jgi:hypothetical protein
MSTPNRFGLYRLYRADKFPIHDPDENTTTDELLRTSIDSSHPVQADSYYPYPNESSFLLGEWYWNGSSRKSESDFNSLLKIVAHPEFRPEDVAGTSWRHINVRLGDSRDKLSRVEEPKISGRWNEEVPFHKRTPCPGLEELTIGKLH